MLWIVLAVLLIGFVVFAAVVRRMKDGL